MWRNADFLFMSYIENLTRKWRSEKSWKKVAGKRSCDHGIRHRRECGGGSRAEGLPLPYSSDTVKKREIPEMGGTEQVQAGNNRFRDCKGLSNEKRDKAS